MSLFIGVYKAIYDYEAQNEEELSLQENDLLYLLETSEVDDWWKVKRRVVGAEAEEPAGLVPSNYIEPAPVLNKATALFDYDKQTDEELSFQEGVQFDVYDTSDNDWILVGLNQSQFGFVPANYIEIGTTTTTTSSNAPVPAAQPYGSSAAAANFLPPPQRSTSALQPPPQQQEEEEQQPPALPAKENGQQQYQRQYAGFEPQPTVPAQPVLTQQEDEEESAPPMPSRPRPSQHNSFNDEDNDDYDDEPGASRDEEFVKDDFFTWPVHEIDSKGKKIKNTLGVGNATVYLSPEASTGGTPRQWKVTNLLNYSNEKKHVFLEFEKPYANVELHAGSKDAAEAILSILGDIKGAVSMKGLQEVKAASKPPNGNKTGRITFDFDAATEDELSVKENDIVYIINDKKSKDWWLVQNADTGDQGLIPSFYVELNKTVRRSSSSNLLSKMSNRVANPNKKKRREKEREKLRAEHAQRERDYGDQQRERRRSKREKELRDREERDKVRRYDERERQKRDKKSAAAAEAGSSSGGLDKSKPNPHRVRTWIDRSGSFKVEAEFLGCVDGKIHLHKTNGVKIAVAAPKLSTEDIEYVERITGMSLENYKPKPKTTTSAESAPPPQPVRPQATGVVDVKPSAQGRSAAQAKDPDYDWFEFFLKCGVDVNNCQRYQLNFNREQMDENILEDISPSLLRTLGLREGDILRVMKYLDSKFDRKKNENGGGANSNSNGGIFQSANGNLSTDRLVTGDKVDGSKLSPVKSSATMASNTNNNTQFEDDAWAVKPAVQTGAKQDVPSRPSSVPTQQLNGSISDLINLKPIDSSAKPPPSSSSTAKQPSAPVLQPIRTGGALASDSQRYSALNPQLTSGTLNTQFTGGTFLAAQPTGFVPIGSFIPSQMTGGFITAQPTGLIPLQTTGFIPLQKTGGFVAQQPTGGLIPLQRTGGGVSSLPPATSFGGQPSIAPIATGGVMPLQKTGGFVPQTSFGAMLVQKTGGNFAMPATSFNQAPAPAPAFVQQQQPMSTGFNTGMIAQKTGDFKPLQPTSTFNGGISNGFGTQQPTGFGATTFGTQQPTGFGGTTFGAQQPTGFGGTNPQFPPTSFGQSFPQQQQQQQATGFFNPQQQPPQQQQFNMNNLSNMFQNTSITGNPLAQQQQQPFTSFGQQQQAPMPQFGGFPGADAPLQSQPTGFGFGNGGGLQAQKTGRANLANATPDNPFGF